MNKIEKLILALLVLGSTPSGLLAMDDDENTVYDDSDDENTVYIDAFEEADQYNQYTKQEWRIVPYVDVQKPAEVIPPAVPVAPVDDPARVPLVQDQALPVFGPDVAIYLDQRGAIHNDVEVSFTQVLSEKLQPLMTKKGLFGLTSLVLVATGLRYAYVSSVIKQLADLQTLRANCDTVLKAVLAGNIDPELVEVEAIFCYGLDQELQDKLENALNGYNIALQQVCHELCAHQDAENANSTQVQQARRAMAVCKQVIDECEEVLVKKPTVVDSMVKNGSVWAQVLTAKVKSATTALAHRFKRTDIKEI